MLFTKSLPVPNSLDEFHKVGHASLGSDHGASPSSQSNTTLVVDERLFSWSGATFSITTQDGTSFGNDLKIEGKKAFPLREQLVLRDGTTNEPVVVCFRSYEMLGETFNMYSTHPLYPGQKPSKSKYNKSTALYDFAKIDRDPFSTTQKVTLYNEKSPSYTVYRAGSPSHKRVVKRHGRTAALLERGGSTNSYSVTVSPGIDPCLVVCLAAVCDAMDDKHQNRKDLLI